MFAGAQALKVLGALLSRRRESSFSTPLRTQITMRAARTKRTRTEHRTRAPARMSRSKIYIEKLSFPPPGPPPFTSRLTTQLRNSCVYEHKEFAVMRGDGDDDAPMKTKVRSRGFHRRFLLTACCTAAQAHKDIRRHRGAASGFDDCYSGEIIHTRAGSPLFLCRAVSLSLPCEADNLFAASSAKMTCEFDLMLVIAACVETLFLLCVCVWSFYCEKRMMKFVL